MNHRIGAYLTARGLHFTVHDGVHVVPYGLPGAESRPPAAAVLIWSGAAAANGIMVELHTPALAPDTDVETLVRRCNEWNIGSRATKARVHVGAQITVVVEAWLPLPPSGVSDDVLHDFLDRALSDMIASVPGAPAAPASAAT